MEYEVVIGMETHVELDTNSKMFCACSAHFFGAEPNINVCPTCMGMPGALPVINQRAVEFAMMVGVALNCQIARHTFWERKSYWYPDLPKGYQITQYQYPSNYDGWLDVDVRDLSSGNWTEDSTRKRIRIRRAHLEEDTGKLTHAGKSSYVDYNRSGVPLLEIVTEPDIHSADEAYAYLSSLQQIVRYLGVSTGDMEKGAMRCEPNMSLRPKGSDGFGTKVEIKNLNSLRAVRDSISYEIKRQTELLNRGEAVRQVTLGWDDARGVTFVQRDKEDAHDYRYFPEPDLPPLDVSDDWLAQVRAQVPELALARHDRYRQDYGFSSYDATILSSDRAVAEWFESVVSAPLTPTLSPEGRGSRAKLTSNWIQTEVFRLMKANGIPNAEIARIKVKPAQLAELIGLVEGSAINNNTAKQVFEEMFATGADAKAIVEAKGLAQVSDEAALQKIVDEVLAANPQQVQQVLAGQDKLFGFLVGQAMKATKGKGNAQVINQLLRERIDARRTST
jgi:aspartyl-tRNA(Asn)/glutamyl-tRNA(Gln) amidotransferase subunit B